MANPRAPRPCADPPEGGAAPGRCSGQGAGSAMREMQRRQLRNPRPGSAEEAHDPQTHPAPDKPQD